MKLAQAWGACSGNSTARNTPAEVSNTATVSPAAGWVNCSSADSMWSGRAGPPPALSAPPRHPARQSAIAKPKASRAFLHLPDIIFSLGHMLYHVHPIVFPADACRARPFDFQYTTEPAGARGRGCEKYKNRVLTVFPNLAS